VDAHFEDSMKIGSVKPFILSNIMLQYEMSNKGKSSPVLFMSGPPGIGKSEVYEQLCREQGFGLSTVYMAQTSISQISGLPMVKVSDSSGNSKFVPWSIPEIFRMDNLRVEPVDKYPKIVILLLDDCHLIDKSRQNFLFQLLLQKRINNHALGPEIIINLAGNGSDDKAGFQPFLSPITNRIFYLDVRPDYEQWVSDFAYKYGIRNDIIEFLSFGDFLMGTPLESQPWPSPRSWTFVSDSINEYESMNYSLDSRTRYMIAKGHVGKEFASEYVQYVELLAGWEANKILAGTKSVDFSNLDRMHCYGLITACINQLKVILKSNEFDSRLCKNELNIFKNIVSSVSSTCPEVIPLAIRTLVQEEIAVTGKSLITTILIDNLDKNTCSIVADMLRE